MATYKILFEIIGTYNNFEDVYLWQTQTSSKLLCANYSMENRDLIQKWYIDRNTSIGNRISHDIYKIII